METGRKPPLGAGKIIAAILSVEERTTGEVRVHISKNWMERNAFKKASFYFQKYHLHQTQDRNGVLVYVNLKKKKFAIVADEGFSKLVGQKYWNELSTFLKEDLESTHFENAISLTVRTLGETLTKYFPRN